MREFIIDTDTASDDAVAILMALAAPDVRVLALTTVAGNVGLEQATRNALYTCEVAGAGTPVFKGAAAPLIRRHEDAHWFHGHDGFSDHGYAMPKRAAEAEYAVEALVRLAREHKGVTLVTLGPLTNIALALARDPALPHRVGRCVVMGGAPCCEGNVTAAAEYNIWVDPEAARKDAEVFWDLARRTGGCVLPFDTTAPGRLRVASPVPRGGPRATGTRAMAFSQA